MTGGTKEKKFWKCLIVAGTAAVLLCFIGILLICNILGAAYEINTTGAEPVKLSEGWVQVGEEEKEFSFPVDYTARSREPLVLERELEEVAGDTLKLHFLHLGTEVYLDDVLIYEYGTEELPFSRTPGREVHFVSLPADYAGKTCRLVLTPLLEETEVYRIITPEIGTSFALIGEILETEWLAVAGALVLMVLGSGITILVFFMRRISGIAFRAFYLGIFALTAGIFCFCETELALLLIQNPYVIHTGNAVALQAVSIPLYGLFYEVCKDRGRKLVKIGFLYGICNFAVQNVLNFAGRDYRYFVLFSHVGVVFCIIVLLVIFVGALQRKDKDVIRFSVSFVPIIIFTIPELVNFYWMIPYQGFFFEVGIFVFIFLQLKNIGTDIIRNYHQAANSQMFEKLAMTDHMTKLKNRTAYQYRLYESCEEEHDARELYCAMADVNHLKMVNDTYGHEKGDLLILETAQALAQVFGTIGEVYRIGGDEFAVIVKGVTKEKMAELADSFISEMKIRDQKYDVPVEAAFGYTSYRRGEDKGLEEAFIRADARMYDNKKYNHR